MKLHHGGDTHSLADTEASMTSSVYIGMELVVDRH